MEFLDPQISVFLLLPQNSSHNRNHVVVRIADGSNQRARTISRADVWRIMGEADNFYPTFFDASAS